MDTSDAGSSLIQTSMRWDAQPWMKVAGSVGDRPERLFSSQSYMQAAREALQGAQYNLDGGYSSTG